MDPLEQLWSLVHLARAKGADAADAILIDGTSQSVKWRQGKIEDLEQAEAKDLGLRVFVGKKQALVSSSDCRKETLDLLVERAVAMAKEAPEDPYNGLADPSQIAKTWPELTMADSEVISVPRLIEAARLAEEAALSVSGVTQCEQAQASSGASRISLVATNGFAGTYERTGFSLMASALASSATGMERDYDYDATIFHADLLDPVTIGHRAGKRVVKKLGARKMPTAQVPVVFDPRTANSLLGHLASAINGAAVARGTSFLLNKLGEKIMPENIVVTDDPFRARGMRSKAFDGEGLLPQRRAIIDHGTLTTWILDLRSARQLNCASTGHASRGTGAPSPSPTNLFIEPGKVSPQELMSDIKSGLYVTDLMGMGVNGVTGDYSRGASGFWIENGEIAFPVNEITIAGNLKNMFQNLQAANDLAFKYGIDTPTLRIDGLTVAGL